MTMEQLNKQMEQYQKGSLEHCIGMELLELCKGNEGASEIVEQDLAKKGMALSDCAKKAQSMHFTIPFDRQELADYLCVERSAMSAELGKLKKTGILDCRKNEFWLKEM